MYTVTARRTKDTSTNVKGFKMSTLCKDYKDGLVNTAEEADLSVTVKYNDKIIYKTSK